MPSPLEPILPEVDLPVIDISEFPEDLDGEDLNQIRYHPLLPKLRKACKEWGFFFLVNHGIPVDLLQRAENVCRDLLAVPTEVKERILTTGNVFETHYRGPNFQGFRLPDPSNPALVEKLCAKIYPDGNPIFCETIAAYSLSVSNLGNRITKVILASLGLDANAFYHSHFENCGSVLRINGYSAGQLSMGEETLVSHTDIGCLTILYQDDVGGLQIRSEEGEWFNVKPLSHSFVVNMGDSFTAWSNGRCRSADHRVVYKGWRDRISFGFFTTFPEDTEIWAPVELVDDDNPRRYKPFIYSDFKKQIMSDKGNKEKATALDKFAGI
ncbi:hypothetical protein SUGI_0852030 [Cryptomeria japonica]|uniref:2-oxoglutarate-dependent dioxygenase DAO-like n=1 Tax=Cryptomeria japonica TaxID=3369 RepID=UPI0024149A60|nr:2-oxoglutarate-dependent dioxygenase DAO-like [Cryptomeria japonica]GLJ41136.1 hypothetical protein SUGI_0852030 [Cryptomeria japonica]